jgi:hypothetical protein
MRCVFQGNAGAPRRPSQAQTGNTAILAGTNISAPTASPITLRVAHSRVAQPANVKTSELSQNKYEILNRFPYITRPYRRIVFVGNVSAAVLIFWQYFGETFEKRLVSTAAEFTASTETNPPFPSLERP